MMDDHTVICSICVFSFGLLSHQMPEKVMPAHTLHPNVNTCTGQLLTFAQAGCTVRLKRTVHPFSCPSLFHLSKTLLFCLYLHFSPAAMLARLNAELGDTVDKINFFCLEIVSKNCLIHQMLITFSENLIKFSL